jgi:hypothetical protein
LKSGARYTRKSASAQRARAAEEFPDTVNALRGRLRAFRELQRPATVLAILLLVVDLPTEDRVAVLADVINAAVRKC